MKTIRIAAFALAAAAMLAWTAGCQTQTNTQTDTAAPAGPQQAAADTPAPSATAPSADTAKAPETGAANTTTPAQEPAPQKPAPEPPAKTYKINKNYDIVPKAPDGNKKVVLLTFDDGPKEKEQLVKMLDALDKHKAKAIFFVNGYRVKSNPDLLKLIHERGQTIGNHSWDHIDLKKEKEESVDKQIKDVQRIVKETVGVTPAFFRPPFGSSNDYVKKVVKEQGMAFMTWSNGSEDWLSTNQKPEGVIKRVLEQLHYGSNILMHELPWTAQALDELLTKLEEQGYSFVDPQTIETSAGS